MKILDSEKLFSILRDCYIHYSKRLGYFSKDFKYKPDYTEYSSAYNFSKKIKGLNKEYLTVDWLFDYFNFQFTYWSYYRDNKLQNENTLVFIKLHWVVGNKALERFNKRTKKNSYFYHSIFYPKYNIKKDELVNLFEDKGYFIDRVVEENDEISIINNPLSDVEEKRKKNKFYNTEEGFFYCIQFTTLFKFTSNICVECDNRDKCKRLLKSKYPNIYRQRLVNNSMYGNRREINTQIT